MKRRPWRAKPSLCQHGRVLIQGIDRAYDPRSKVRVLRGTCQECLALVRREQSEAEILGHEVAGDWYL